MLIKKVVKFHKNKLSNRNLIFKHNRFKFNSSLIIAGLTIIPIIIGAIIPNIYLMLGGFLSYFAILYYINKSIKSVLLKQHGINIKENSRWEGLEEYKVKQLQLFLQNHKLASREDLKNFISLLEKETESLKSNIFRFGLPGLFLAMFIPVWNHFNNWIMSNTVSDLQTATIYLFVIIIFITMISIMLAVLKDIKKLIFETDYRRLKELAFLLELVYLSFDESIDKTIEQNL